MKFPMKRSIPPPGNVHQSRKSPRPNKNEIWELAMSDEIDEDFQDSDNVCTECGVYVCGCTGVC